jgi:hypothetical protein
LDETERGGGEIEKGGDDDDVINVLLREGRKEGRKDRGRREGR